MFNCLNNKNFISRKDSCLKKRGFTLIETVLALALLIILVIIVYDGFVSTIQLSANTSKYEATGDLAAGQVNSKILAASTTAPTPTLYAIHLESSVFASSHKNLGVYVFKATPTPNTTYGLVKYRENVVSTNRSGFWYCGTTLP